MISTWLALGAGATLAVLIMGGWWLQAETRATEERLTAADPIEAADSVTVDEIVQVLGGDADMRAYVRWQLERERAASASRDAVGPDFSPAGLR